MKKIFKFGKDQLNASIALAIAEGKIPLAVNMWRSLWHRERLFMASTQALAHCAPP